MTENITAWVQRCKSVADRRIIDPLRVGRAVRCAARKDDHFRLPPNLQHLQKNLIKKLSRALRMQIPHLLNANSDRRDPAMSS